MNDPVFDLVDAGRTFGPYLALSEVSLTVAAGERVGIIGASGAGKTTLLSLLNGSLRPTFGAVRTFGTDVHGAPAQVRRQVQRRIGTVTQDLALVDQVRVLHNVNAGRLGQWSTPQALASLLWPRVPSSTRAALNQVDMEWALHERTDRLSGGERQRIAVARVLVHAPDVILADEPVSRLDPVRARIVLARLTSAAPTLVMSLHQPELAAEFCTRIIGLSYGRVVLDVPRDELSPADLESVYAAS